MAENERESDYGNDSVWVNVQRFLPERNRLTAAAMPREYYISVDRANIHIDHYAPSNPAGRDSVGGGSAASPKGTVILFHGVGGNGRLLSFIALPLAEQGFEVVCPDMPLYGYTRYDGNITYREWVSYGVEIVKRYRRAEQPLFLFGLSAGGMLAYQIACESGGAAGVMSTCVLDQRLPSVTRQTAKSALMGIVAKPLLSAVRGFAGSVKLPMKWIGNMKAITNNGELAALLMQDPKSSGARVPLSFVHSMLHPVIKTEPECFTDCPFLLAHPGDDRWTDVSLSRLFYDRLACRKELVLLEGAGHFLIEERGLRQLEGACVSFMENCMAHRS